MNSKLLGTLISCVFVGAALLTCSDRGSDSAPKLNAYDAYLQAIPFGKSHVEVLKTLEANGMTSAGYDQKSRRIFYKLDRAGGFLTTENLLLEFHFSENDQLVEVKAQREFTGP